jgi:hypothetical protein
MCVCVYVCIPFCVVFHSVLYICRFMTLDRSRLPATMSSSSQLRIQPKNVAKLPIAKKKKKKKKGKGKGKKKCLIKVALLPSPTQTLDQSRVVGVESDDNSVPPVDVGLSVTREVEARRHSIPPPPGDEMTFQVRSASVQDNWDFRGREGDFCAADELPSDTVRVVVEDPAHDDGDTSNGRGSTESIGSDRGAILCAALLSSVSLFL